MNPTKPINLCVPCMEKHITHEQEIPYIQTFLTGYCDKCNECRGISSTEYIREKDMSVIKWIGPSDNWTYSQLGAQMYVIKRVYEENNRTKSEWLWGFKSESGIEKGSERKKKDAVAIVRKKYNQYIESKK